MDRIYLDHAATTPLSPAVLEAMMPFLTGCWGNPSSIHAYGREARRAVENARRQVAAAVGCDAREVYFTSGGSESDNWALKGAAFAAGRGSRLVVSAIEHHAVLRTADWLEEQGFPVTRVMPDREGFVSPEAVRAAAGPGTALVSVMAANNEVGTLEPVRDIAAAAHEAGALFHTDAVQAVGAVPVDMRALGCDLLSLSAHKLHGPKGVGALCVRRGTRLDRWLHGGAQEGGRRAGTENVAGIVGLGKAVTDAVASLAENSARVAALRDRLLAGLREQVPGTRLNGPERDRLPGNLNVSFDGVEGESLLLRLDLAGVAASSGSACTSGSLDPSHVLTALGLTEEQAHGSLRLTLGTDTTPEEIDRVLAILPPIVEDLRAMRA